MFDPETAEFMQSAPALPGLDPADLPRLLTSHYAALVARRLRRTADKEVESQSTENESDWPLSRIADTYELVTSLHREPQLRRAAAFVAATAQQILAQESNESEGIEPGPILDRERVEPTISAAVLFLAAEQYADAHEAARQIKPEDRQQDYVCTILAENIRDLARGQFHSILRRSERRPASFVSRGGLEQRGVIALFETLVVGLELFAAEVIAEPTPAHAKNRFDGARTAFTRVLELSSYKHKSKPDGRPDFLTTYPGPRHLAALLLAAYDATSSAAITRIPPPFGSDGEFWKRWLMHHAQSAPFMWPNHRIAVHKGFHETGKSAVLVLPTGAGKTTVSCLKIAGVLGRGKSVVFIAPTHALVDQLTEDLQKIFPESLMGSNVSSDFDRLFAEGINFERIEVMTPERCLALLSYAPGVFQDVGLLVFDECHLLSPISGLRRALDGMFCVLAFNSIAPQADFLFLSAMLQNGEEFARWIGRLTGRSCVFAEPLWKPSRQARGVVFYENNCIDDMKLAALEVQRTMDKAAKKKAKGLRTQAVARLACQPYALFGLQHNWLKGKTAICAITRVSDAAVPLSGELKPHHIRLKPNVNKVAARIAGSAARNKLKGIVFVSTKRNAVSTAREISELLGHPPKTTADENERWNALEWELGDLKHSILSGASTAVPHNAQMIRLERDLAERMFRRNDGAQIIVATPTLAQGLNLPAHIAILAGDRRTDPDDGGREALEAHEILNAAARAGRAGHLANGIVLLIPEEILTFHKDAPLTSNVVKKLKSVLPEDDRCLTLRDPLQVILDLISASELTDPDVEYALNRLSTVIPEEDTEPEASARFAIPKSFAAFAAEERNATAIFQKQVSKLNDLLSERSEEAEDKLLMALAAQSGAPVSTLKALRHRLIETVDTLPQTIPDWITWIINWLIEDDNARTTLLGRDRRAILGAVGRKKTDALSSDAIKKLEAGVRSWVSGKPLCEIERSLGGDPEKKQVCPRSRELVTQVIPLGLSFVVGLVARTAREIQVIADGRALPLAVLDCLATGVRRGFDSPSKLAFADVRKGIISRVQVHLAFDREIGGKLELLEDDDYGTIMAKVQAQLSIDEA